MTATDEGRQRTGLRAWVVPLTCLCVALVGSALTAVLVRSDVLTGRAAPVTRPTDRCIPPESSADRSPTIPGNAPDAVFGLLPLLPLPGLGPAVVLGYNEYRTAAEYTHFSSSLLSGSTRSALEDNHFRQADTIGYQAGPTFFGAEAFQFGSPDEAASFEHRTLLTACQAGVATDIRPLDGLPGGLTFVYHDGDSPAFRAVFLVGDAVVRLNVCTCVEDGGDPTAVLAEWARDVNARMRAPLS